MKTTVSSILLVLTASFIGSFGAVFLKAGAGNVRLNLRSLVFNPRLALGVALFLGSSVFYMLGLRQGELSVLYPLVSLGYVFTLLWSRLFFHESFTRNKLLGLSLILLGIMLIGVGGR